MFWIVDAGLLNRASPFRAGNCHRQPSFPPQLQPDCSRFVALEAIAWVLCKPVGGHEARNDLLESATDTLILLARVPPVLHLRLRPVPLRCRPPRRPEPPHSLRPLTAPVTRGAARGQLRLLLPDGLSTFDSRFLYLASCSFSTLAHHLAVSLRERGHTHALRFRTLSAGVRAPARAR